MEGFTILKLFNLFDNLTVNVHGDIITGFFIGIATILLVGLAIYAFAF